jgi:hypothetical protein
VVAAVESAVTARRRQRQQQQQRLTLFIAASAPHDLLFRAALSCATMQALAPAPLPCARACRRCPAQ